MNRTYRIQEDGDAVTIQLDCSVGEISFGLFRDLTRLSYASQDTDEGTLFFTTMVERESFEAALAGALFTRATKQPEDGSGSS